MKSDFQIKVILGFNDPNYRKLMDRIGESRRVRIGYDINPYSINVWTDDVTKFRKIDPIYGHINYVGAFFYLEEFVICAGNSVIEDRRPMGMIWDVLIGSDL